MHQVLSYETAVRANSSREFREYVTKRTCVSLVLTLAFFTLISGYLLGTFVTERKQHIMKMKDLKNNEPRAIEITSKDYEALKQIRTYQKTKDLLLTSALNLEKRFDISDNFLSTSLNAKIFNKYISCTTTTPPNTTIDSHEFIEQLVDVTAARQRDCMRQIQIILDDELANAVPCWHQSRGKMPMVAVILRTFFIITFFYSFIFYPVLYKYIQSSVDLTRIEWIIMECLNCCCWWGLIWAIEYFI